MQTSLTLQSWLEHLRILAPITGLVHVGAGTGQAIVRYMDWNIPSAVLIEADESYHDKLSAIASEFHEWSAHIALLSDQENEKIFHFTTNSNENSVLTPESLSNLWRNLKAKEQIRVNAITLDSLLTGLNHQPENMNWVVIDCLPALPILRGASKHLNNMDVIIARVILDDTKLHTPGVSKVEVDAFLSEHGYRCVASEEELHPAVGMALYVRNWKPSHLAHTQDIQKTSALQSEAISQLQKKTEEQTKLAADRQIQIQQLAQAKDEQTRLANDRYRQLEDMQKRYKQVEAQNAEYATNQTLLQNEIARAEAQIDLIKDVLLPEQGL